MLVNNLPLSGNNALSVLHHLKELRPSNAFVQRFTPPTGTAQRNSIELPVTTWYHVTPQQIIVHNTIHRTFGKIPAIYSLVE